MTRLDYIMIGIVLSAFLGSIAAAVEITYWMCRREG